MSTDVVSLEQAEIDAFTDLYRAAPPELAAAIGLSVTETPDAIVLAAAGIDVLALNRALGLGLRGAVSAAAFDDLVDVLGRRSLTNMRSGCGAGRR